MTNERIGIVLLNFNTYKDTIKCIEMYKKQELIQLDIVIVDNNSSNDSFEILSARFEHDSKITVLQSGFNGGYAFGNNVGARFLIEKKKSKNIIISNNDIFIENTLLLSSWLKKHSDIYNIGISSPYMYESGTPSDYAAWKLPRVRDDLISSSPFLEKILGDGKKYPKSLFKDDTVVECLPGSLFMISASLFERVGFFDEGTFLYMEEVILARKINKYKSFDNYLFSDLNYEHSTSKTISKFIDNKEKRKILFNSKILHSLKYRQDSEFCVLLIFLFEVVFSFERSFVSKMKRLISNE